MHKVHTSTNYNVTALTGEGVSLVLSEPWLRVHGGRPLSVLVWLLQSWQVAMVTPTSSNRSGILISIQLSPGGGGDDTCNTGVQLQFYDHSSQQSFNSRNGASLSHLLSASLPLAENSHTHLSRLTFCR